MGTQYREYPSSVDSVDCTWEQRAEVDSTQLVVPDGCIDLIWLGERELVVAGPDVVTRDAVVPGSAWTSGVRLRPGAAGVFLEVPPGELRGAQVAAEDVLGSAMRRLPDDLSAADLSARRSILIAAVRDRAPQRDPLVASTASCLTRGSHRISDVARELGFSERQLHRRVLAAVGYGPKSLGRILRLQRLRRVSAPSLADRAYAAGYASQAHMSDEVRRLTGRTPVRFLEDPTLTAL